MEAKNRKKSSPSQLSKSNVAAGSLSEGEKSQLFESLKRRFENHPERHEGIAWEKVLRRLEDSQDRLWSLREMERTGGEPDVIAYDEKAKFVVFAIA